MHQIQCRLGLCSRPHWRSLQLSPRLIAGLKGAYFYGHGRERRGREEMDKKGKGKE